MIIYNHISMANPDTGGQKETQSCVTRLRGFMASLTAAGLLATAGGCADAASAEKPNNETQSNMDKKFLVAAVEDAGADPQETVNSIVANTDETEVVRLAEAQEAKAFSMLPRQVQNHIRSELLKCMADVEDFSRDGNEDDPASYQIEFNDGEADCDNMRKNGIRSAIARESIKNTTRSITEG